MFYLDRIPFFKHFLVLLLLTHLAFTSAPLEERLLEMLGIPGPPKGRPSFSRNEVSQYMLELYAESEKVLGRGVATAVKEYNSLPTSGDMLSENRWQFLFSMTDLTLSEKVVQGHLRVFKPKGTKGRETPYRVSIFHEVDKEDLKGSIGARHYYSSPYNSSVALRILDTLTLETRQSHWCSFDIAEAIRFHQERNIETMRLHVYAMPENATDILPGSRGIRFVKSRGKQVQLQPSIVIYTDDGSYDTSLNSDARLARQSEQSKYDPSKTYCQRKPLYVDFNRLGWDWIIGPTGFDAYMCQGDCPFPYSGKLKITNHAYLQSAMGSIHSGVPKPCCAPTALSPITLMYLVNNGVIMREYKEMKVEECGCA